MVKKTYYEKGEAPKDLITEEVKNTEEKDPPQSENINFDKDEIDIKKELSRNVIEKKAKAPRAPRPYREKPKRDEKGNLLRKNGEVDKRGEQGLKNLAKSRVYQQILANKKLKEEVGKVAVYTPFVESEDSEDEIEFDIQLETPPEPPKKEDLEKERKIAEALSAREAQVRAMEMENKKLKDTFHFNSHLNRLQQLSTNVKLKF